VYLLMLDDDGHLATTWFLALFSLPRDSNCCACPAVGSLE